LLHRLDRRLGQSLGVHIPLVGQPGLDRHLGPVAMGDHVPVVFDFLQHAQGLQVGDDLLTCLVAVQAAIGLRHLVVEASLLVEDVDPFQVVAPADLEVVEVVGRGHLEGAAAGHRVHIVVRHDLQAAAH
jgi:hypothetical protein